MKEKHLFIFNGQSFYYNICDMNDYLESIRRPDLIGGYRKTFLVNLKDGEVCLDQNAPLWYRKLATIHEYTYWNSTSIPEIGEIPASPDRRALIDIGIYQLMNEQFPDIANEYLLARLNYYDMLLDEELIYSPEMSESRKKLRNFIRAK